jgi:hypothetical protein
MRYEDLLYIAQRTTAGTSNAALAADLNLRGVLVPRQDTAQAPYYALRYSHGYALNTDPGYPNLWTAAAVAELKTSSDYSTTGSYSLNPLSLTIT